MMQLETVKTTSGSFTFAGKINDYRQLIKFSLSFMVVFASVVCYLMAPTVVGFNLKMILLLFVGGMLVTGSANAVNQVVEKETDAQMKRTAGRPIASGRMSVNEGWAFAIIAVVAGVLILGYFFNWTAAMLSILSWFIYAFMYTPLKKVSSFSVLLGAVPGAFPCLIGWTAGFPAGEHISWVGGWVLFGVQFFWQFPHFWAIAWLAHKDYTKAGFRMLPSQEGPTRYSAIQAIAYSLVLIPIGFLPYLVGLSGIVSMWIVLLANVLMVWQSVRLYREMEPKAARRVMFSSYIYLPVVLLVLLADKL